MWRKSLQRSLCSALVQGLVQLAPTQLRKNYTSSLPNESPVQRENAGLPYFEKYEKLQFNIYKQHYVQYVPYSLFNNHSIYFIIG